MSEYFPSSEWKINLSFSNLQEIEEEEGTAENLLLFQDYQAIKEKLAKKISASEMLSFLTSDNLENATNTKLIK